MASQFSITSADLTPDPIPATLYTQLLDDDADDVADVDVDDVIAARENEFISHTGGMFGVAANIALAKPQVILVCVFGVHFRKAQNSDFKVPEDVRHAYKAALKWADTDGKRLLEAEGALTPPDGGGTEYSAPTSTHGMTELDLL